MDSPLILHFIDELKIGGAQTHLVSMIEQAKKKYSGRHHVVSLFGGGGIENELKKLGIEVTVFNFEKRVSKKKFLFIFLELFKLIKSHKPSHVEVHLSWSRLFVLPIAWLLRIPNRFAFEHGDIYLTGIFWKVTNFTLQFFASKIILCSYSLQKWYISTHKVFKFKTKVMHIGIKADRFANALALDRTALGATPHTFLFCAAGSMGKGVNKRFDIIIDALVELKNKFNQEGVLVICGDGPLRPELEAHVKANQIESSVRFLGMRSDVERVMAACNAFCHAAPFEPFGMVIVEAMLCSLPVIVPNVGGPVEIVEPDRTGFTYEALDSKALAQKMSLLITDRQYAISLGQKAKAQALSRFAIEDYVDHLYSTMYRIGLNWTDNESNRP
ncbi:MAG: glycosyltransferase [Pseudomonadota bacterium]|nr:glycosyltransferase [Pseudomonadota bacterium]